MLRSRERKRVLGPLILAKYRAGKTIEAIAHELHFATDTIGEVLDQLPVDERERLKRRNWSKAYKQLPPENT